MQQSQMLGGEGQCMSCANYFPLPIRSVLPTPGMRTYPSNLPDVADRLTGAAKTTLPSPPLSHAPALTQCYLSEG